jgi:hypothetical protein
LCARRPGIDYDGRVSSGSKRIFDQPPPPPSTDDGGSQRFARELLEILNELRIALPGVQILFGFMLVAPFNDRFDRLSPMARDVFFAGFLAVTVSSALLIAPSVYHRLHWRRDIEDKERMLRTFTALTTAGIAFLALALTCVIFVYTDFVYGSPFSLLATAASAALLIGLWFGLPLARRRREPRKTPIEPDPER